MARIGHFRKARRGRRALLLVGALLVMAALQVAPSSAWVGTDQPDYAPGSTVTISGDNRDGAGYLPGEAVHVTVSGPNGYAASCDATADATGAWSCQVTLPSGSDGIGDYSYTATGSTSGVSQTGTFTDGPVDTYTSAAHTQIRHWFLRGDTVYAKGIFANNSILSYRFRVIDPSGTTVRDSACIVRTTGSTDASDTYVIPANALLGATSTVGWTYTFEERTNTTCSAGTRSSTQAFRVAQLYAFASAANRNACGTVAGDGSWSTASCSTAQTTFPTSSTVYVRVLGLQPDAQKVSVSWLKPSGTPCINTAGNDRPSSDATDGHFDTAYPPPPPEDPNNTGSDCSPATQTGLWKLDLADGTSEQRTLTFDAFTIGPSATVSTTIHDTAHAAVTTVAVGTHVHDFVSVSGGTGNPVPTGTVTVAGFDGSCSSLAGTSSPATLGAAGTVDVTGFELIPATAGPRGFRAHYSGDSVYGASDGSCEVLNVVDANIQIGPSTATNPVGTNHVLTITVNALGGTLDAGPHTATANIDSGPGGFVGSPTCTYTGGGATASCQVTLSSATTGTTSVSATANIPVSGVTMTRSTDGTGANSGPATKYWADDTVTTVVRDAAGNDIGNTIVGGGTVVHDEAKVAKATGTPTPVPNPTGTVNFTLYDNGTCDGNVVATDPNKPLNASGTATSATFTTPAVLGPYSYKAALQRRRELPGTRRALRAVQLRRRPAGDDDRARPGPAGLVLLVRVRGQAHRQRNRRRHRCGRDALPARRPTAGDIRRPAPGPVPVPGAELVDLHRRHPHALRRKQGQRRQRGSDRVEGLQDGSHGAHLTGESVAQFQPSPGAFTVSWSGTDATSGIKDFDVRYRTAPPAARSARTRSGSPPPRSPARCSRPAPEAPPASRCAPVTTPAGRIRTTARRSAPPRPTTTRS